MPFILNFGGNKLDKIHIETAKQTDAGVILALIRELAVYENMSHLVEATVEMIEENVFDKGGAQVLLAKEDGEPVGFALFFENFSTFKGKCGVYLEDLYVKKEKRGKGYGKALFSAVMHEAKIRGAGRMEWACLDWNKPSIDFYLSMGAQPLTDWTLYRLDETALDGAQ